jgi:hypothetical protein
MEDSGANYSRYCRKSQRRQVEKIRGHHGAWSAGSQVIYGPDV